MKAEELLCVTWLEKGGSKLMNLYCYQDNYVIQQHQKGGSISAYLKSKITVLDSNIANEVQIVYLRLEMDQSIISIIRKELINQCVNEQDSFF